MEILFVKTGSTSDSMLQPGHRTQTHSLGVGAKESSSMTRGGRNGRDEEVYGKICSSLFKNPFFLEFSASRPPGNC